MPTAPVQPHLPGLGGSNHPARDDSGSDASGYGPGYPEAGPRTSQGGKLPGWHEQQRWLKLTIKAEGGGIKAKEITRLILVDGGISGNYVVTIVII